MLKTLKGIYQNGEIILEEEPKIKKSKIMVVFLAQNPELKKFRLPTICKNPIQVNKIKK